MGSENTRTEIDQDNLEREMLTLGCDRVRVLGNRQKKNKMESLSKWGEALSAHGCNEIVLHLRAIRRKIEKGAAGKNFASLTPLTYLPAQQVAACGVRTVIDSLSANPTLHSVATDIADKLWIETMLDRASLLELKNFRRGRSRKAHKMAYIRRMEATDNWQPKERMASGVLLIELIEKYTGLIEIKLDNTVKPARRIVLPTEQCLAWVSKVKEQQELMTPNYLPMYIPPRPWTSTLDGGYRNKDLPLTLMKSNSKLVAEKTTGKEQFIQAANIHQSVPWKVNAWMYEQIEYAYDRNMEVGCLLPRDGWPIDPYPKHLEENDPGIQRWRYKTRAIHEKNDKTRGARIAQAKTLWVARRFIEEQEIYFPMSLDFRGRYYYRPPYLNPQGNDVARSLLLFANGTKIDSKEAEDWLRIHGANLYGLGKSDWQTRIDWTEEKLRLILDSGNDPWTNAEFWMRADKPWSFLAFCRSFYLYRTEPDYKCNLPVMLDCTCSGIQHYASLLRSKEMGILVNLENNETPRDIYTEVITKVNQKLRATEDHRAKKWLMLQPDRSLAKPCVMTTPYSATNTAFYYFAYDWATKRARDLFGHGSWTTKKGSMSTMHYMARLLHKEATSLIEPAVEAMKWFKFVGRIAGKNNVALEWVTPSGLPVHQEYSDTRLSRIRMKYLSDIYLDIRTQVDKPGLDTKRMSYALSANVLHSFDSSHMAATTVDAMKYIQNIGGIHDCFTTTPAEMSKLRDSVRITFADMYAHDWLTDIKVKLTSQIPGTKGMPSEPQHGTLDPNITRYSNYFIT